ncbi:MAG: ABC transporter ATP-binding protein [Thermoleophilia bacterium]|nr:ABC transporter ATP-binding protein [Thermoleophilia bacterium]
MPEEKELAIKVDNLTKVFRIPHEKHTTLKAAVLNVARKRSYTEFQALDEISFEVKKGEFFGIIGRNGCGKSTLLKIIAGIYVPTSGKVKIDGRISPFLELGVGFNPELTARENIFLGGSIHGLSRKSIEEKFDKIVEFSELQEFIDMKLKNYSSGMQVRLAFALAIHAHAEVLLMDEVLAVGDSNFQNKCLEEFNSYREQGKTVVLVTHDIGVVQRYCDRAMLLRNGKIVNIGKPEDVGNEYMLQNMSDEEQRILDEQDEGAEEGVSRKDVAVTGVEFLDEKGEVRGVFSTGDDITARIHYFTKKPIEKPVFGVAIHTQDGINIAGPNTRTSDFMIPEISGEGYIDFIIKKAPLFTGAFNLTVALFDWNLSIPYSYQEKRYIFRIKSADTNQYGVVKLETAWKI